MSTINAQSIINEVMQSHAIAPSEYKLGDFITFKTSARGTHRVLNCKENLQRFADLVRKNAAAFGGGLVREAKTAPAVSYASKTISLYKQLIEDRDYFAALQLAEEKLSPLFFFGTHAKAYMQVAPIPLEDEPRFVSTLSEDGRWAVIEPVSMLAFPGDAYKNKRSRDAQIENVMQRYSRGTEESKESMFAKAYAKPADQDAARAQWMQEHGIVDDAAIEARIEAQAAQDVAEVVSQAVAVSAIAEAMAPEAAEEAPELVTCEAGEREAQDVGDAIASGNITVYPTYMVALGLAPACGYTSATPVAISSEQPSTRPMESAEITAPSPEPVPAVAIEATTPAMESTAEPVTPVVGTEAQDAPAVETETDAAQEFDQLDIHKAWLDADSIKTCQWIISKSGVWRAWFFMVAEGFYGLRFSTRIGGGSIKCSVYRTAHERMESLTAMVLATTTPPDIPPDGGLPIEPIEAPMAPVAECTPGAPVAESRAKPEHDLQVGDVVRSSWGYDQTNVNHYQITKLIGKRTVEVRELAEHQDATGHMSGRVAPVWGEFTGEPMRRTVDKHGHVNILREKFGRASKIEPVAVVHGVRCYASTGYSSYA